MSDQRVLVTGSNGFIGAALVGRLKAEARFEVVAAVRDRPAEVIDGVSVRPVGNIDHRTNWSAALKGVSVVIHTAARVHVMRDEVDDPLTAFRTVNVDGTLQLAESAIAAGVSRFIFVSSIKVNGERTGSGEGMRPVFRCDDVPSPSDAYGRSKHEAEVVLAECARRSGLELAIIRPPLVYGDRARGNFPRLVNLVKSGVPLPFASIRNQRSLISVQNLVDCLVRCTTHPNAPGRTFLVSDGQDVSTPKLIEKIAFALDVSPRLVRFPTSVLRLAGRLAGRKDEILRMTESLQVDITPTMKKLQWKPPVSQDASLRLAVKTT